MFNPQDMNECQADTACCPGKLPVGRDSDNAEAADPQARKRQVPKNGRTLTGIIQPATYLIPTAKVQPASRQTYPTESDRCRAPERFSARDGLNGHRVEQWRSGGRIMVKCAGVSFGRHRFGGRVKQNGWLAGHNQRAGNGMTRLAGLFPKFLLKISP